MERKKGKGAAVTGASCAETEQGMDTDLNSASDNVKRIIEWLKTTQSVKYDNETGVSYITGLTGEYEPIYLPAPKPVVTGKKERIKIMEDMSALRESLPSTTRRTRHNADIFAYLDKENNNLFHLLLRADMVSVADIDSDLDLFLSALWCEQPLLQKNVRGRTPLHVAALNGLELACRKLLIYGSDPTIVDVKGNTPLHLACLNGHRECAKLLTKTITYTEVSQVGYTIKKWTNLTSPAIINGKNGDGLAPIHIAAEQGDLELVKYLVQELGCDLNLERGKDGCTPIMVAIKHGHRDVSTLLEDLGADMQAENYDFTCAEDLMND